MFGKTSNRAAALALAISIIGNIFMYKALRASRMETVDALIGQGGHIVSLSKVISENPTRPGRVSGVISVLAARAEENIIRNEHMILEYLPSTMKSAYQKMRSDLKEVAKKPSVAEVN